MGSDQQFALCFSRPPMITKEGTEAGAMTLGGVDTRLHESQMVYTPNFDSGRSSFFSVKVRRAMLRDGKYGEKAQSTNKNPNMGVTVLDVSNESLNRGGVIVDSGTTDTYWNSGISKEFSRVFKEIAGIAHSNKALTLNKQQVAALPTILFQLYSDLETNSHVDDIFKTPGLAGAMDSKHPTDVILAIPPSHYMEYNPDTKKYTSRFYPDEHGGSVLGANAMMGHDVFFDVDTKRIGWAESSCDYTHTIENEGYSFEIDGNLKALQEIGSGGSGNNNKNNKNSEPAICEDISVGQTCQEKEGCRWGYGKCTTKAAEPQEQKEDAEPQEQKEDAEPQEQKEDEGEVTAPPTTMPSSVVSELATKAIIFETQEPESSFQSESGFSGLVDSLLNPTEPDMVDSILDQALGTKGIMIGFMFVIASLVLCCIWCLFCRSAGRRRDAKYSTVVDPSIEMTNGGDRSFQDEPDHDDDDDDDDMDENRSRSNGSRSSSQFKDESIWMLAPPTPLRMAGRNYD